MQSPFAIFVTEAMMICSLISGLLQQRQQHRPVARFIRAFYTKEGNILWDRGNIGSG
jgi:hypothetical protein